MGGAGDDGSGKGLMYVNTVFDVCMCVLQLPTFSSPTYITPLPFSPPSPSPSYPFPLDISPFPLKLESYTTSCEPVSLSPINQCKRWCRQTLVPNLIVLAYLIKGGL